jgi:signal transduction histidine kinase
VLAEVPLLIAVFQNLLSNALKFSGEKAPRVVVTVRRDEPFWLFSFSDNGIGIEPEYSERIFVIFQRLHERTAYAGTGIGLSMTRKIIEYFGGQIWLDTTFTGGTRFCFTLPMPQETMTPELEDPIEDADNQNAAALLPAPDPAAEPDDRQDEEIDGRLR